MIGSALKCLRCGHEWNTRTDRKPVQCPRCKSPAWDRRLKYSSGEHLSWAAIAEMSTGWGDPDKSDEEMLNEVGSGWGSPEDFDD